MRIPGISLTSRIKMYFDITCPATWATIKIIRREHKNLDIDYVPIADSLIRIEKERRVDLHRHSTRQAEEYRNMAEILSNPAWNDLYSRLKNLTNAKNNEEDEEDTWRLWHLEDIPTSLKSEHKENWKEINEELSYRQGEWPMLYLTSVKMHHPDKYLLAIDKIGNRLWKDELSTVGDENIVDCGRGIGLELEESLYIDRNMVKMWQELINSSREFLAMEYYEHNKPKIEQGKRSPMFLFPTEISEIVIFQDWNQCPQKYFREKKVRERTTYFE